MAERSSPDIVESLLNESHKGQEALRWAAAQEIKRLRSIQPATPTAGESSGKQLINEILAWYAAKNITPGEGWAFTDDNSSLCFEDSHRVTGHALWVDLEDDGRVNVLFRPNDNADIRSIRFVAPTATGNERFKHLSNEPVRLPAEARLTVDSRTTRELIHDRATASDAVAGEAGFSLIAADIEQQRAQVAALRSPDAAATPAGHRWKWQGSHLVDLTAQQTLLRDVTFWNITDEQKRLIELAPLRTPDAAQGWRDISTAPKDGTRILLFQPGRGAFEGWWHDGWPSLESYWMDDQDSEPAPTHWQPTLAIPSTEGK